MKAAKPFYFKNSRGLFTLHLAPAWLEKGKCMIVIGEVFELKLNGTEDKRIIEMGNHRMLRSEETS